MRVWSIQEAKAKFSELLETCTVEGTQIISKRGVETAVLIPIDEWKRLIASAKPSLKELLLNDEKRFELNLPTRNRIKRRSVPELD